MKILVIVSVAVLVGGYLSQQAGSLLFLSGTMFGLLIVACISPMFASDPIN